MYLVYGQYELTIAKVNPYQQNIYMTVIVVNLSLYY